MRRAWKEIILRVGGSLLDGQRRGLRLVAPPREEKPWDCLGELESPSKDAVCVLVSGGGAIVGGVKRREGWGERRQGR